MTKQPWHGPLAVFLLAFALTSQGQAQMPFFNGAEGYGGTMSGTMPTGGWFANATIYHVTRTDDAIDAGTGKAADGTLRRAFLDAQLKEAGGNVIVVFDVGGTFQLTEGSLNVKNIANYYVAGQTAPSPVTIYGNTTQVTHSSGKETKNIALRYLSMRKGTGDGQDSVTFAGSGLGSNLIFDHLSASWSEDEIISVTNNNTDVTVQYSMINDALVNSHAYGSLLRAQISSNVSVHHNLYANNASRQARFGSYNAATLTADFRNNVVYNWRDRASYAGGSTEPEREYADVNYVGNYLVAGPETAANSSIAFVVDKNVDARIYQWGNYIDPDDAPGGAPADGIVDGTNTGWSMFQVAATSPIGTLTQMATPFATPAVTTQTAANAYDQVVDYVGNWWWNRDAIDSRVIGNVTGFATSPNGIGPSAPNAAELSALLAAPVTTHAAGYDTDGDGMPNAWEIKHGLNPNSALDAVTYNAGNPSQNDFDLDGYTNLQEYLDEIGAFPAPAPIVFNGSTNNRYAQITNWKTDDGGITAGSYWQPSRFDLAVVSGGTVVVDAVGQHAGTLLVGTGSGNNATLNITAGWLEAADAVDVGSSVGTGRLTLSPAGTLSAPQITIGSLGTLDGSGTIQGDILNNGLVSPGTSIGTVSTDGDFAQNPGATLRMEIASLVSFDQLNLGGMLLAGGTLDVNLLSYSPQAGDSFDLLDFTSSAGSFTLDLPTLTSGLEWDTTALMSTGTLSVIASFVENADFDSDGDVDGTDFLIWQRGFGNPGSLATGDANNDGTVNGDDLAIWQNQYGVGNMVAAQQAVPEPSGLVLLTALMGCLATRGVAAALLHTQS